MKRGKKYIEAAKLIERGNLYDPAEAVALVKKSATEALLRGFLQGAGEGGKRPGRGAHVRPLRHRPGLYSQGARGPAG